MSDFDDHGLNDAFDEFASNTAGYARLAGTDSVRATVAHRRRVRTTALSALAVLVIAVPITTYVLTSHGGSSPPVLGAAVPSPSVSTVVSASPTAPSGTPSSTSSIGTAPPLTDGVITMAELASGSVTIPAWPSNSVASNAGCVSGKHKLVQEPAAELNHAANTLSTLYVAKVVHTNLDADAGNETAALVSCQFGEVAVDEIVAFDRNSSGQIVTLGVLARGVIWDLTARSGGGVTINISDSESCCEDPKPLEAHQTRSYAWTGANFVQVGGPAAFLPHTQKIMLKVTLISTSWSASNGGVGTVTVKVANPSTHKTGSILVWDSSGGTDAAKTGPGMKIIPALAGGASVEVTLTVDQVAAADRTAGNFTAEAEEIGGAGQGELPEILTYHF